jgi:hypothetical protein
MIYVCRKRGALGIATEAVSARNFDEFILKYPELELLATCQNEMETRRYALGISFYKLTRQEYERSILHSGRS